MTNTDCETVNFAVKKYKRMKYSILILFLGLLLPLNGQLLYQITGHNVKTPSYVLGTHSLIPANAIDSIPGVYRAFRKCNLVLSKYDAFNIESSNSLRNASLLPLNQDIKNVVSDTAAKMLDKELKMVLQMGLKELGRLHPVMIKQMYLSELAVLATKIKDDVQSDAYFQRIAAAKGLPVFGTEDYDIYIENVFKKSDVKRDAMALVGVIRTREGALTYCSQLFRAYKANDLSKLEKIIAQYPLFSAHKSRIKPDNHLKDLLNSNSCFYVVDVTDLYGEDNIIEQLKAEGYTVKPYSYRK